MSDLKKCQYNSFFKDLKNPLIVSENVRLDDYFKKASNFDKM